MWRALILFRVEVGGICPKSWHFLPQKKSFYLAQTWATPGRINSTFLAFFLLTLQFRVDGCLVCAEKNRGMRTWKNHENMDSNHTCEQTRNNHWKQTSTQVSPSYLEDLGYLYLNMPETTFRPLFLSRPGFCVDKVPWRFPKDPHLQKQKSSEEAGGSETLVSQKLKHNRRHILKHKVV